MKKEKIFKIFIIIIATILFIGIALFGIHIYRKYGVDPESWVAYLRTFGIYSAFVLLAFQLLQVFLAIIPGEIIEIATGLMFHPFIACIICYIGVFLASALIFFIIRKMGKRLSKIFISEEKLHSFRFINTNEKLKRTTFLLFLIPGTPKDLLTYFFALTPIKFVDFIVITIIARFPSVFSSVIGGNYVAEKKYINAIIVFVVTAIISLLGLIIYDRIKKTLESRRNHNKF